MECNDYGWKGQPPESLLQDGRVYVPGYPDPVACKASCLTNQKYHNKKIPIFGEKSLPAYNLTLQQLTRNSWDQYRARGDNASVSPTLYITAGPTANTNADPDPGFSRKPSGMLRPYRNDPARKNASPGLRKPLQLPRYQAIPL